MVCAAQGRRQQFRSGLPPARGRCVVTDILWIVVVGVIVYASLVLAAALIDAWVNRRSYRGERADVERGVWGRRR